MPASSQVTVKALGLNINPNYLDLPNGSLIVANDVIIRRENVIESRRGLSDWSAGIGSTTDTMNQLIEYKGRILAQYQSKIAFDTGTVDTDGHEIFTDFAGSFASASSYRMRFIEANKNLYITTSDGIKKISAASASEFSSGAGYIRSAGAVKSIDFTATLDVSQGQLSGFLPNDSTVAYRTVWGYKDANNNLVLGAPSSRVTVYNFLSNTMVMDFDKLLTILDIFGAYGTASSSNTLITDQDFYSLYALTINPIVSQLKTNVINVAEKLDSNILLSTEVNTSPLTTSTLAMDAAGTTTVTFSRPITAVSVANPSIITSVGHGLTIGSTVNVFIAGTTTTPNINGLQIATVIDANTFSIPVNVTAVAVGTGTFTRLVTEYITTGDWIQFAGIVAPTSHAAIATFGGPTSFASNAHGFLTGDNVVFSGFSTTPDINGSHTITRVDANNFTINVTTTAATNPNGFAAYANLTQFNAPFQVTSVTSNTLQFIYTPTTGTPTAIAATPPTSATKMNSYNYTRIIESGDDSFPVSLNDTGINIPSTAGQNATIENTISRIVTRLRSELPAVISASLLNNYLVAGKFDQTLKANVKLKIGIPSDIDTSYFVQVYRSNVFSAFNDNQNDSLVLGTTVIADDELHLVLEYFPNAAETTAGYINYLDQYPDELAQTNTPLYTNPSTGDGILQSNDIPPFAKDINSFKNVIFYANTKTRHTIPNFQLLGVDNIVNGDQITIGNVNTSNTYTFIDGAQEKTTFTLTAADATALKAAIQNKYFTINSVNDNNQYYVWYRYDASGVDPMVAGKTGIVVDVITGDSVATVCQYTADTLGSYIYQFTTTSTATTFVITNIDQGIATDGTIGNISGTNLVVVITTPGTGEDAANGQVLISRTVSAAINIDLTARSLIRVINYKNNNSPIYAYYTSSDNTSPGQIDLEAKTLSDTPFYIIASGATYNSNVNGIGNSFSPDISPVHVTTGTIATSPITGYVRFTATAHGLQNGDQVIITYTNSDPTVNGVYNVANVAVNTFDVLHSALTTPGTRFSWEKTSDSVSSTNDTKPNRIYFSKLNQPEAVPLLNFFDIGPEDKAILRIFPLRSSLFVYKEDGLYRVSGEISPFQVQLFDSSCVLIAPDSLDVADNTIFAWTNKGITNTTESGTNEISTPVDIALFRLSASTYPNFKTLTWGIGYNSDNSYTTFTNSDPSDTVATLGFRYCTLTRTWTNVIRTQTCGLIRSTNDLLYMGDGTSNIINQERKSYTRTDYADKDFTVLLNSGALTSNGRILQFTSVDDIDEGDVFVQTQYITIYTFNALLQKLDIDPGIHDTNYYSLLFASAGDNMRNKLVALAQKLDADSGTNTKTYYQHIADQPTNPVLSNDINNPTFLTTASVHKLVNNRLITLSGTQSISSIPSLTIGLYQVSNTGTWGSSSTFSIDLNVTTGGSGGSLAIATSPDSGNFIDIQACYNAIIGLLNADVGITFNDYQQVTTSTPFESVVNSVNRINKKVTMNITMPFIIGPIQVYKAISNEVLYSPLTFGDPLSLKQVFQGTIMFNNTAFTRAIISFSSDLKPEFFSVPFNNLGNGIFGSYSDPGFGFGYFGGLGNSKPFRTLIPLQTQRCRYINVKYNHKVAREVAEVYGVTLTANVSESFRAYR